MGFHYVRINMLNVLTALIPFAKTQQQYVARGLLYNIIISKMYIYIYIDTVQVKLHFTTAKGIPLDHYYWANVNSTPGN